MSSLRRFLLLATVSIGPRHIAAFSGNAGPTLGIKSTAKEVVDAFAAELTGKVAVVTGGNSGIGLETVKALASAGCRVILACRVPLDGETATAGLTGIEVRPLDLADLASVCEFAAGVAERESKLDFLVLNAGVMATPTLERTVDGFEKQIGVNHFGHALLTRLLRPTLEATVPSRVVSVASTAHSMGELDTTDLHFREGGTRKYSPWGAYGQSKLANILSAKALSARLPDHVASVSLHPGVIRTPLWRSTPAAGGLGGWLLGRLVADRDMPQGAATTLFACVAPAIAGEDYRGVYLKDCAPIAPNAAGRDAALSEALWRSTEEQLDAALAKRGLSPDGKPAAPL